jgi:hypothetical protein
MRCPLISRPSSPVMCCKDACALWDESAARCSHLTNNLAWAEIVQRVAEMMMEKETPHD